MCQKLGKKHPQYADRNANMRDEDGKCHRNWNETRVITMVYGFHAINAYTDLRDKMTGGLQWTEDLRMRPVKVKRLERISRCQSDQRASGSLLGPVWYTRVLDHQRRNNYTVVEEA